MSIRDRDDYLRAYRLANRETINAKARAAYAADPEKTRARHRAEYAANPTKRLASQKTARDADPSKFNARVRAYYAANLEKERARNRAKYHANPEPHNARTKRHYASNVAWFKEYGLAYRAAHPGKHQSRKAKRRATELRATPQWSEAELIAAFYAACPPGAHVDHWAPLQGKTVCGLHVLANLQYLTQKRNNAKHNRMPTDTLPPFVASKWISLMLVRFYSTKAAEEAAAP